MDSEKMIFVFKFISQRKAVLIADAFDNSKTKACSIRMFCFPETIENAMLVQRSPAWSC